MVFPRKGFQEPGVVPRHFLYSGILFIAVMGAALPGEVILPTLLAPHDLHDFSLQSDHAEPAVFCLLRPRQSPS